MSPSSGFMNLLEQLTDLRKTLKFTSLSKDLIKGTDEPPDEGVPGARSARVRSAEASVPVELGCVSPTVHG